MTKDELVDIILELLPNAVFDEEFGTGEIVIATGKIAQVDGRLRDVIVDEPF
jgi:hypothetical protein